MDCGENGLRGGLAALHAVEASESGPGPVTVLRPNTEELSVPGQHHKSEAVQPTVAQQVRHLIFSNIHKILSALYKFTTIS